MMAHVLGLGTCWINAYGTDCEQKAKRILLVPEDDWLVSVVSIGYPEETPEKGRKGLDEITFTNKYGSQA